MLGGRRVADPNRTIETRSSIQQTYIVPSPSIRQIVSKCGLLFIFNPSDRAGCLPFPSSIDLPFITGRQISSQSAVYFPTDRYRLFVRACPLITSVPTAEQQALALLYVIYAARRPPGPRPHTPAERRRLARARAACERTDAGAARGGRGAKAPPRGPDAARRRMPREAAAPPPVRTARLSALAAARRKSSGRSRYSEFDSPIFRVQ